MEFTQTIKKVDNIQWIRENKDKVDWTRLSLYSELFSDVNIIREFSDYIQWAWISQNENFNLINLKEFEDYVNWVWISRRKDLTEDIINEFYYKVDWEHLYVNKIKLSNTFLIKHYKMYFGDK